MIADAGAGRASRRVAVAGVIVACHLVLALMLTRPRPASRPAPTVAAITVASLPSPPPPASIPREIRLETDVAPPTFEVATPTATGAPSCDVLDALAPALQADPAVSAALASTAAGSSRAIMAWNGKWPEATDIMALRHAVTDVLRVARTDCLDEAIIGPRLIFLAVDGTTMSVAIGSGTWHWRDLLSSD